MRTSATNRRLRQLLTGVRDGQLVPDPDFQRRLVWSNLHKVKFVQTVLDGLPFPEVFVSAGEVDPETGDATELIVDGQQRITTLLQYFQGDRDLKLPPETLPYAELSKEQKVDFLEYEVVVRDLGSLSEKETREIFNRINSTKYSLNAMEVNNSRFDGPLKRFAEKVSGWDFFQRNGVFTALDGRRMNDTRLLLVIIVTMLEGYFNRDDELTEYLAQYNDDFPHQEDVEGRLLKVVQVIEEANFAKNSRIWQKADLLTALIEIDRKITAGKFTLDPPTLRQRAESFYSEVSRVSEGGEVDVDVARYYGRVRSGINDKASRVERGSIWSRKVLG